MTLLQMIKVPFSNIKISYYTENGVYKDASDMHISMFTDEGIEYYQDILNMSVTAMNKEDNVLYLKDENKDNDWVDKVNDFWSFLNHYGAFKWNGEYKNKLRKDDKYQLHKQYFTFTDEITE